MSGLAELRKRVRAYERATIEMRRAQNAGTQPRKMNAGNRLAIARYRMFQFANSLPEKPTP